MTNKEILNELIEAQKFQAGAWKLVIEAGRQYAHMKTFGSYVEKGRVITVSNNDRKDMETYFHDKLLRYCEDAFREDALIGALLAKYE